MNGLLLNLNVRRALLLAGLWGFVLFTATLALPNISLVFIVSSVLGGANDFVVVSASHHVVSIRSLRVFRY
jgi:hypothetical protein